MKKLLLLLISVLFVSLANANIRQGHYKWRNDDGTIFTATDKAPQDQSTTIDQNEQLRLRIELYNDIFEGENQSLELYYSTSSDVYAGVWTRMTTTSSEFQLAATENYNETDLINTILSSTYSYDTSLGLLFESSSSREFYFNDFERSEFEFSFKATSNVLINTPYYFRIVGGVDIYDRLPSLIVNCVNPSSAGIIGNAQFICPGSDADEISSISLPTGHFGTLEYKWQQSTTSSIAGFTDIASSNSATYDPPVLTATTWYKRLARVDCKSDWLDAAESNVIEINTEAITIEGVPTSEVCRGSRITLTATSINGGTISWDNGITNGVPFSVISTTTFTATSSYPDDCPESVTVEVLENTTNIIKHPETKENIEEGSDVNFLVLATGIDLSYQWRKDGVKLSNDGNISGATRSVLSISDVSAFDDGDYDCVVFGRCLVLVSQSASLSTVEAGGDGTATAIGELAKEGISMYPNPVDGKINLEFGSTKTRQISISDLKGRIVLSKTVESNFETFNLSGFDSGIYIITIQEDTKTISSRIVKQ